MGQVEYLHPATRPATGLAALIVAALAGFIGDTILTGIATTLFSL